MSTRIPVVFIHGLWPHASSWQAWSQRFEAAGYAPVAPAWPAWPGEAHRVEATRTNPERVAGHDIDDVVAALNR